MSLSKRFAMLVAANYSNSINKRAKVPRQAARNTGMSHGCSPFNFPPGNTPLSLLYYFISCETFKMSTPNQVPRLQNFTCRKYRERLVRRLHHLICSHTDFFFFKKKKYVLGELLSEKFCEVRYSHQLEIL